MISCQRLSTSRFLVKNRWPPRSNRYPVALDGHGQAADLVGGLEDGDALTALGQQVPGGQSGRAAPEHEHGAARAVVAVEEAGIHGYVDASLRGGRSA